MALGKTSPQKLASEIRMPSCLYTHITLVRKWCETLLHIKPLIWTPLNPSTLYMGLNSPPPIWDHFCIQTWNSKLTKIHGPIPWPKPPKQNQKVCLYIYIYSYLFHWDKFVKFINLFLCFLISLGSLCKSPKISDKNQQILKWNLNIQRCHLTCCGSTRVIVKEGDSDEFYAMSKGMTRLRCRMRTWRHPYIGQSNHKNRYIRLICTLSLDLGECIISWQRVDMRCPS